MGPPLLRFSWVLHTQARASDRSNRLLSHHSLPRMTTSWDLYSCSKTLCNEGHSPSCSQRHWTNTSTPWSALVLILHTNSWDRNTFYTLEEFSAEDFLQNLEPRGSVSDCQLVLLPPLERDEMKPEFVSEACPSLQAAALWKAPLLELKTVVHNFMLTCPRLTASESGRPRGIWKPEDLSQMSTILWWLPKPTCLFLFLWWEERVLCRTIRVYCDKTGRRQHLTHVE